MPLDVTLGGGGGSWPDTPGIGRMTVGDCMTTAAEQWSHLNLGQ